MGQWSYRKPIPKQRAREVSSCTPLWQGRQDKLVPFELQRYVVKKLPWIKYHEVADGGHLIIHQSDLCEASFRELLPEEEPTTFPRK